MKLPRIVVAGTTSGVGKTSITCAIINGLRRKGFSVQPFKVGPDYIDPGYLSLVASNEAHNLDYWLMGKDKVIESLTSNSKSDISIIEGVMGYYDGFEGKSDKASTYHIANLTKTPTILILDASKTSRSIAATALGFLRFKKNSFIKGIILNKIGSKKHENLCKQALEQIRIPILGMVPRNLEFDLQSRHLGLIPVKENKSLESKIKKLSRGISDYLDIDKIIEISKNQIQLPLVSRTHKKTKSKTTIAVALDNSFNFYYKENLEALRSAGANLKFFSPMNDTNLSTVNGIYIGGGFPEILGKDLEKNQKMKGLIKKMAENNIPIYAECGGLMYLNKSIEYGGKTYKMVGLFDGETKMTNKMKLNYTLGRQISDSILSEKSNVFHGHEFHYSELENIPSDSKFAYDLQIGEGIKNKKDGLILYNTLASYGHIYFNSDLYAQNLVKSCIKVSRR